MAENQTSSTIKYIKPQCMPYFIDENNVKVGKAVTQGVAYTSDGFILPCCWCDAPHTRSDFENLGMYQEKQMLKNNSSITDVIQTNPWKEFINRILYNPDCAPKACKKHCGIVHE